MKELGHWFVLTRLLVAAHAWNVPWSFLTTRSSFLNQLVVLPWLAPGSSSSSSSSAPTSTADLTLPLVPLTVGGCLVTLVLIGNSNYYATIDTGSPFLTAPPLTLQESTAASVADDGQQQPLTEQTPEQYGEAIGNVEWRRGQVTLGSLQHELVFGIPADNVLEETGGLFVGLMDKDDARPTVLQQLGYRTFCLDWRSHRLVLSNSRTLQTGMPLYSLSPYGPNLHHYAVECGNVTIQTKAGEEMVLLPSRKVVVVFDSGLTGCILSDSWKNDLPVALDQIQGATLALHDNLTLSSQAKYWYLSCFRLPWFTSEDNHPHIIAAGATFLIGTKLTVDSVSRRLLLET